MNFKKILFVAGLAVASFTAYAQDEVETEYVFNPHWYIQGQFGFQHTLGEIDWSDLNSPNAQLAVGYNWSSVWGARLSLNAWQSKAGIQLHEERLNGYEYKWKWNYVSPTVDLTMNLSNLIAGFNPKRVVDISIFAGVGANIRFNNDEAQKVDADLQAAYPTVKDPFYMRYLWDGNKTSFVGQWGIDADFKINDRVSVVVEANWNTLTDRYNSKKAGNTDWYFNTLAGVKINLGKTYTKRVKALPPCEPQIIEKEVIKEIVKEVVKEPDGPIRRDIFFVIRGSEVSSSEMPKLEEIAAYMEKHPTAKVSITGYADKGTGNPRVNKKYSEARAKMVAGLLHDKFGISNSRISYSFMGDTEQPYAENDLNRLTICVAE